MVRGSRKKAIGFFFGELGVVVIEVVMAMLTIVIVVVVVIIIVIVIKVRPISLLRIYVQEV